MNLIIISEPRTESKGCNREDGYWMYEVYVWAPFCTSINSIAHSAEINKYHCSFLVDGGQTFHTKRQTSLKTYENHVLILLSTQFQIKKIKCELISKWQKHFTYAYRTENGRHACFWLTFEIGNLFAQKMDCYKISIIFIVLDYAFFFLIQEDLNLIVSNLGPVW